MLTHQLHSNWQHSSCSSLTGPSKPCRSPARLTSMQGKPAATSSVSCVWGNSSSNNDGGNSETLQQLSQRTDFSAGGQAARRGVLGCAHHTHMGCCSRVQHAQTETIVWRRGQKSRHHLWQPLKAADVRHQQHSREGLPQHLAGTHTPNRRHVM